MNAICRALAPQAISLWDVCHWQLFGFEPGPGHVGHTENSVAGTWTKRSLYHSIRAPYSYCWPLVPKFAGSNPAEAVGFLRVNKNPQHVGGHGCLFVVIVVCCQVEVSATG
jgi:hypothetical protein